MRGSERKGFEPSVWVKPYNGLAISRFRPLSHLSESSLRPILAPKPGEDRACATAKRVTSAPTAPVVAPRRRLPDVAYGCRWVHRGCNRR